MKTDRLDLTKIKDFCSANYNIKDKNASNGLGESICKMHI